MLTSSTHQHLTNSTPNRAPRLRGPASWTLLSGGLVGLAAWGVGALTAGGILTGAGVAIGGTAGLLLLANYFESRSHGRAGQRSPAGTTFVAPKLGVGEPENPTVDWEWEIANNEVRYSSNWLQWAGVRREDVSPSVEFLLERVAPEAVEQFLQTLARVLGDREVRADCLCSLRGSSGYSEVSVRMSAERNAAGETVRVLGVQTLRSSVNAETPVGRGYFEDAMGAVGVGVAYLTCDHRLARISPAMAELAANWASPSAWWHAVRDRMAADGVRILDHFRGTILADVESDLGDRTVFEITFTDPRQEQASGAREHVMLVRDVTAKIKADESLRESEERYALASRAVSDGLWDWQLTTGEIYFSPRWLEMLGINGEPSVPGLDGWLGRVHPEDLERLSRAIDEHLEGLADHFESTYRMLHTDGCYRWMLTRGVVVRDESGTPYRMAGSQSDITEQRLAEERLLHGVHFDALTGLANRTKLMETLAGAQAKIRPGFSYGFAILFLDIDRFKLVNDSLGHLAGDELLKMFAERLNACIRLGDTVARLGGDEFCVFLDNTSDAREAIVVADRIQNALHQPFEIAGVEVFASASIGIAQSSAEYRNGEDLLRDADTAMYRAKSSGRARFALFDADMHVSAKSLLNLHTDLRRAIDRAEFEIQYQPIVLLETGRVAGFEALLRWRHPERGLIWPEEFVPVAEENGLIVPIAKWVLSEACSRILVWQREFSRADLFVSVNLSGKNFADASIVDVVAKVLADTGLEPVCLKLEVTESVIMHQPSAASEVLRNLKRLGVQLYLDDFGTGYSSLSYLHEFSVDALKVDRSFVNRIASDDGKPEIVTAIASLARSLNMSVVAEGIQTTAQLSRLRKIGCDYGQGYLFSRPLDADYARGLIEEDPQW